MSTSPWKTCREAAEYAGVCTQTFRAWVHRGLIPASRAGVQIRIHVDDIDDFLRSRPVNGPAPERDGTRHGKKTGPRKAVAQ